MRDSCEFRWVDAVVFSDFCFHFSFSLSFSPLMDIICLEKGRGKKKPTALSNHLYKRNFNFGEVLGKALTDTSTSTNISINISISKGISFSISHRHSTISLSHPLCMFIHQIDHRAYVPLSLCVCALCVCIYIWAAVFIRLEKSYGHIIQFWVVWFSSKVP